MSDPPPDARVPAQRRPFFSPKSLAAYLDLSERTVRSMIAEGVIPSYLIGGARRIDPADVDTFLTSRRTIRGATSKRPGSACDAPGPTPGGTS